MTDRSSGAHAWSLPPSHLLQRAFLPLLQLNTYSPLYLTLAGMCHSFEILPTAFTSVFVQRAFSVFFPLPTEQNLSCKLAFIPKTVTNRNDNVFPFYVLYFRCLKWMLLLNVGFPLVCCSVSPVVEWPVVLLSGLLISAVSYCDSQLLTLG